MRIGVWGQEKHQPLGGSKLTRKILTFGVWLVVLEDYASWICWKRCLEKVPNKILPNGTNAYLHLPRGAEWMVRGAYTTSLRVPTAPFGRCWYKCWFFMVMNPMVQSACKKSPETYPSFLLKQKSL